MRDTGVPVELSVTGTVTPLSAGVDLAAYRVVQEALTNAVKHAPGSSVRVAVHYGVEDVWVEVSDTGGARPGAGIGSGLGGHVGRVVGGSGSGLIGLRERLAVYGGTLHTARHEDGGFLVRAVIPREAT